MGENTPQGPGFPRSRWQESRSNKRNVEGEGCFGSPGVGKDGDKTTRGTSTRERRGGDITRPTSVPYPNLLLLHPLVIEVENWIR